MNQDLVSYYRERATEYEKIYSKPERQDDLKNSSIVLQEIFNNKKVLEIACGTGYWTEKIAETASLIHATDINKSVIEIAQTKHYKNPVTFEVADLNNFIPAKKYDAVFGGFIWSHILLQKLDAFVNSISSFIKPGGTIVFMDNNYVEGSNHPITNSDEHGNTYQSRKLEDGSQHLVLKNFPEKKFLLQKFSGIASAINYTEFKYFWMISFKPEPRSNK